MRLWLGIHPSQADGPDRHGERLAHKNPEALALFLAAGPERDPRSEG